MWVSRKRGEPTPQANECKNYASSLRCCVFVVLVFILFGYYWRIPRGYLEWSSWNRGQCQGTDEWGLCWSWPCSYSSENSYPKIKMWISNRKRKTTKWVRIKQITLIKRKLSLGRECQLSATKGSKPSSAANDLKNSFLLFTSVQKFALKQLIIVNCIINNSIILININN